VVTKNLIVSVDVVALTLVGGVVRLLAVRRAEEPFAGRWALPGVRLGRDETLADAAYRAVAERSGLSRAHLEQLYTFDDPRRDPRDRALSVAHLALLPLDDEPTLKPGRGSSEAAWLPLDAVLADVYGELAFDHTAMARYAYARVADKLRWTPLAFRILPPHFTLAQLRTLFEAFGTFAEARHEGTNFLRLVTARWRIEPIEGATVVAAPGRRGRPHQLYRYLGDTRVPGAPGKSTTFATQETTTHG
jgi:8-oxo-dGTP diphosphatase